MSHTDKAKDRILQIHLAEYQAVSSRATTLLTVNSGILAVVIGIVGLGVSLWYGKDYRPNNIIFWSLLFITQMLEFIWLTILYEILSNAYYIESVIKPKLAELVGAKDYLLYEAFIQRLPGKRFEIILEMGVAFIVPFLLAKSSSILGSDFKESDYIGLMANLVILLGIVIYACLTFYLLLRFFKLVNESGGFLRAKKV